MCLRKELQTIFDTSFKVLFWVRFFHSVRKQRRKEKTRWLGTLSPSTINLKSKTTSWSKVFRLSVQSFSSRTLFDTFPSEVLERFSDVRRFKVLQLAANHGHRRMCVKRRPHYHGVVRRVSFLILHENREASPSSCRRNEIASFLFYHVLPSNGRQLEPRLLGNYEDEETRWECKTHLISNESFPFLCTSS